MKKEAKIKSLVRKPQNRKYTLKPEYYDKINKDVSLRDRISESLGGSVISYLKKAKDEHYCFLDYNCLMIIAKYYDKEFFDILDIDNSKPY